MIGKRRYLEARLMFILGAYAYWSASLAPLFCKLLSNSPGSHGARKHLTRIKAPELIVFRVDVRGKVIASNSSGVNKSVWVKRASRERSSSISGTRVSRTRIFDASHGLLHCPFVDSLAL